MEITTIGPNNYALITGARGDGMEYTVRSYTDNMFGVTLGKFAFKQQAEEFMRCYDMARREDDTLEDKMAKADDMQEVLELADPTLYIETTEMEGDRRNYYVYRVEIENGKKVLFAKIYSETGYDVMKFVQKVVEETGAPGAGGLVRYAFEHYPDWYLERDDRNNIFVRHKSGGCTSRRYCGQAEKFDWTHWYDLLVTAMECRRQNENTEDRITLDPDKIRVGETVVGATGVLHDPVNHPSHYDGGFECIEVMELIFGWEPLYDHCCLNAFKYIWRHKSKGKPEEDLRKARWYLYKAAELWTTHECEFNENEPYYAGRKDTWQRLSDDVDAKMGDLGLIF